MRHDCNHGKGSYIWPNCLSYWTYHTTMLMRLQGGGVQGVWTPPPLAHDVGLLTLGPKLPFLRVDLSWTTHPPFQKSWIRPCDDESPSLSVLYFLLVSLLSIPPGHSRGYILVVASFMDNLPMQVHQPPLYACINVS